MDYEDKIKHLDLLEDLEWILNATSRKAMETMVEDPAGWERIAVNRLEMIAIRTYRAIAKVKGE